jgi:hypothetical protein
MQQEVIKAICLFPLHCVQVVRFDHSFHAHHIIGGAEHTAKVIKKYETTS